MTRRELELLELAIASLDGGRKGAALATLDAMVRDAKREHATEDRHNDWAELDHNHPHQQAAE